MTENNDGKYYKNLQFPPQILFMLFLFNSLVSWYCLMYTKSKEK